MTTELEQYLVKQKIINLIRKFFTRQKFTEVITPKLVPSLIPESYLRHFETFVNFRNGKKQKMYLISSPESSIKKLLSRGVGNCFEITPCYRNSEEGSTVHLFEFMMVEWYRVNSDYKNIMRDCENLILFLQQKLSYSSPFTINYQNRKIDLTMPWKRISISELLSSFAGIQLEDLGVYEKSSKQVRYPQDIIAEIARKKGYLSYENSSWENIFHQIFFNDIEPALSKENKPVIVYDYPTPLASLAKVKESNPYVAERFELYIAGLELANCFSELTNYQEQKQRFQTEKNIIRAKYNRQVKVDQNFLEALKRGLPESSGIALGIDRLTCVFTNSPTIHNTLFFDLSEN